MRRPPSRGKILAIAIVALAAVAAAALVLPGERPQEPSPAPRISRPSPTPYPEEAGLRLEKLAGASGQEGEDLRRKDPLALPKVPAGVLPPRERRTKSSPGGPPSDFVLSEILVRRQDVIKDRNGVYGYHSPRYGATLHKGWMELALGAELESIGRPRFVYDLQEIRVGDEVICGASSEAPELHPAERLVRYARGPVEEEYRLTRDFVEQSFVISSLPEKRGAIRVTGRVATNLAPPTEGATGPRLTFTHQGSPALTISDAVAVDAAGRRVALELSYSDRLLTMSVPAEWVQAATLPITVDPLVGGTFTIDGSAANPIGDPYDLISSTGGDWMVTWNEQFGAGPTDYDVFGQRVSASGTLVGGPIFIGNAVGYDFSPAISWSPVSSRYLVVWVQANQFSTWSIVGQEMNVDGTFFGPLITFSGDSTHFPRFPAVAWGDNLNTHLVVWNQVDPSTPDDTHVQGFMYSPFFEMTVVSFDPDPDLADFPSVAYAGGVWCVIWKKAQTGQPYQLMARTINSTGFQSLPTQIVGPTGVAARDISAGGGNFLITWGDLSNRVLGQIWTPSLSAATGVFTFRTGSQFFPGVDAAFSSTTNEWYVAYTDPDLGGEIFGHRVTTAGVVSPFDRITNNTITDHVPRLAWNAQNNTMLLIFARGNSSPFQILGQRFDMNPAPPAAPGGLTATPGNGQVTLSWSSVPNAATYTVKRSTTKGGPYAEVPGGSGLTGTNFVDTDVSNGIRYYYVVVAVGSSGEGANSNEATARPSAPGPQVLFVTLSTALNSAEDVIQTRLEFLGYTVVGRDHATSKSSDANGKAVVLISSTVTSATVGNKFRGVSVPVINWENALHDNLGMTGPTGGTDYGTQTVQTLLQIQDQTHPLAAGFSGGVVVTSTPQTFSWGVPNDAAAKIATLSGSTTRYGIFAYEAGAAMPGLVAPARRVGFFLEDITASSLNVNGQALFDAAVQWATGGAPGAPPPPAFLTATGGNQQVSLSWAASPGASTYTVKRSQQSGGPYTPVATGVTGTSHTDLGLTNGITYYYVVTAVGAAESGPSNEAFATPFLVSPQVLFVIDDTPVWPGDTAIINRLQGLGYQVIVRFGNQVQSSEASGKELVIISATLDSATVNVKFRTSPVPVINCENALHDDMGMTEVTSGTYYGTEAGQSVVQILDPTHPLAAGLTGNPTVTSGDQIFSWGKPRASAAKVGQIAPDLSVIFGYEAGALMPGLVAPARRVGFFLENDTAASLNANGWALFDAAVRWAASRTPGAPPSPTNLAATPGDQQITLNWSASTGATSYTVKRSIVSGGPYGIVASGVAGAPYTDTGRINGRTYYYIVTASTGTAESGPSNEAFATPGPAVGDVLLVGAPTIGAGDSAVQSRLVGLGYAVTYRSDSASTTADATGKVLVLLSSTVTSGSVNTKFRNVTVPVINWENALHDDMGMTGAPSTEYGTTAGQTTVLTLDSSHPLAAGLSGTVPVTLSASIFSWGRPVASAASVASITGDPSQKVIFGYEAGASMASLVAPARRVGFFLENLTAQNLNGNGWKLFDAAVRWARGIDPPGAPPPPTNLTAMGQNGSVLLNWTASPDAAGYNVLRGTDLGGPYPFVAASGVTSTTFTDTQVVNGTRYYYVVTAFNELDESGFSNEATARPVGPPPAPSRVWTTAYSQCVVVEWEPVPGVNGYKVYRKLASDPWPPSPMPIHSGLVTNTKYQDGQTQPLQNGLEYVYRVTAVVR